MKNQLFTPPSPFKKSVLTMVLLLCRCVVAKWIIPRLSFFSRVDQGGRDELGEEVNIDHDILTSSVDYINIHVGAWLLGWFRWVNI